MEYTPAASESCYSQPTRPCPYCGTKMECDWVDVGVGMVQCGPYCCENCGASEIGPEGLTPGLDDDERRTRFYKNTTSPYANTCQGVVVDHKTALGLYRMGLLDEKETP